MSVFPTESPEDMVRLVLTEAGWECIDREHETWVSPPDKPVAVVYFVKSAAGLPYSFIDEGRAIEARCHEIIELIRAFPSRLVIPEASG